MYLELYSYFRHMRLRKELWKDGEFVTAVVAAIAAIPLFIARPDIMDGMRAQFGSLLSAASIVFGFALATLTFYISAVSGLKNDPPVQRISDKLIDWHVWTVLCLLLLVGWILAVWVLDAGNQGRRFCFRIGEYSFLVFLTFYCGGQVVNHTMTLWWFHRRRLELHEEDKSGSDASSDGGGK